MSSQLLQENDGGNAVKNFPKVGVDNIHSLFLISQVGHAVIGDQVGQAAFAFPKPILAGPDPLFTLYVLCDHIQDNLLHGLPWSQGQADRPVVPCILFSNFIVN